MVSMQITLEAGKVQQMMNSLRPELWNQIGIGMKLAANNIVGQVKDFTPKTFSILANSTNFQIMQSPNIIIADIFQTEPYSPYVEFGTQPHWMPINPLKLWVVRKGFPEGVAYYIQKRIAGKIKGKPGGTSLNALNKLGTWGYRMFVRAFERMKRPTVELIEKYIGYTMRKYQ